MKYFQLLVISVCVCLNLLAADSKAYAASSPKVLYLKAYNLFEKAKVSAGENKQQQAKKNYFFALNILEGLKENHGSWHQKEVSWLLKEVQSQIMALNSQDGKKAPSAQTSNEIKALKAEIAELRKENDLLKGNGSQSDKLLSKQKEEAKLMSDTIVKMSQNEKELLSRLEAKDKQLKEYQKQDSAAKDALLDNNDQISKLTGAVKNLENENSKLSKEAADKLTKLSSLEKEFAEYKLKSLASEGKLKEEIISLKHNEEERQNQLKSDKSLMDAKTKELDAILRESEEAAKKQALEIDGLNMLIAGKNEELKLLKQKKEKETEILKNDYEKKIKSLDIEYKKQLDITGKEESEKIRIIRDEKEQLSLDLGRQKDSYENQIAILKQQQQGLLDFKDKDIVKNKAEISRLQKELNAAAFNIDDLNKQLVTLGRKYEVKEEELAKLVREKDALISENNGYQKDLRELKSSSIKKGISSREVLKEKELLAQSLSSFKKEFELKTADGEKQKLEIDNLKKQNMTLADLVQKLESEKRMQAQGSAEGKSKISAIEKNLQEVSDKLVEVKSENERLKKDISNLSRSEKTLKDIYDENAKQLNEKDEKVKSLEVKVSDLFAQLKEKDETMDSLKRESVVAVNKYEEAKEVIKSYHTGEKTFEKQIEDMRKMLKEKENRINSLEGDISSVSKNASLVKEARLGDESKIKALDAENTKLQNQLVAMKQTVSKQEIRLRTLSETAGDKTNASAMELAKKQQELDESSLRNKELLSEIKALKDEAAKYEAEIADLELSVDELKAENSKVAETSGQSSGDADLQELRKQHTLQIKKLNENYIRNQEKMTKKLDKAEADILDLKSTNDFLSKKNKELEVKLSLKAAENI